MKTGKYYFSLLSDEEQALFKDNFVNLRATSFEHYMTKEFNSFLEFITLSFPWTYAPQEFDYWSEISQRKVE